MKKIILVLAAFLCCSLWAFAQTDNSAAQPNTAGQTAGAPGSSATSGSSSAMTVDGCLSGSAGNYTLKDKASGTTYTLAGDTSKLAKHIGHEVQVTGTASGSGSSASSASNATASGNTSALGGNMTLNVTSFKHIATSCSAQ